MLAHGGEDGFDPFRRAQVGANREGIDPVRLDVAQRLLDDVFGRVEIMHEDVNARSRQFQRNSPADAMRRPGDDGDLTGHVDAQFPSHSRKCGDDSLRGRFTPE